MVKLWCYNTLNKVHKHIIGSFKEVIFVYWQKIIVIFNINWLFGFKRLKIIFWQILIWSLITVREISKYLYLFLLKFWLEYGFGDQL